MMETRGDGSGMGLACVGCWLGEKARDVDGDIR